MESTSRNLCWFGSAAEEVEIILVEGVPKLSAANPPIGRKLTNVGCLCFFSFAGNFRAGARELGDRDKPFDFSPCLIPFAGLFDLCRTEVKDKTWIC